MRVSWVGVTWPNGGPRWRARSWPWPGWTRCSTRRRVGSSVRGWGWSTQWSPRESWPVSGSPRRPWSAVRSARGGAGSALSPVGWVMAHAPSTRAGGAGTVVSVAVEFAKAVNAPVVAAVAAGRIPVRAGAAVIAEADKLRPLLADGAEGPVVEGLIDMAAAHGPRGCRLVRPRLLARYGLEEVLQREQDAAKGFVSLSQPREHGPGIFEYALTLDTEGMAVLEAGLGPLSAPKPAAGEPDLRGSDRRRGDALAALVRRAVAAGASVPTTTKAQLFITMDYDRLRSRLGADRDRRPGAAPGTAPGGLAGVEAGLAGGEVVGGTQTGVVLGPETVRRVACDATVLPIVLGGGRRGAGLGSGAAVVHPGADEAVVVAGRRVHVPRVRCAPAVVRCASPGALDGLRALGPDQRGVVVRAPPPAGPPPPPGRQRGRRRGQPRGSPRQSRRVGPHRRQLRPAARSPRRPRPPGRARVTRAEARVTAPAEPSHGGPCGPGHRVPP
ncbi:DUF222 domain-containing protein [Nostocoides sp. HKS02]|nr:DUF222 domain-containing protein [Tetrasphaera sp. HKS02]